MLCSDGFEVDLVGRVARFLPLVGPASPFTQPPRRRSNRFERARQCRPTACPFCCHTLEPPSCIPALQHTPVFTRAAPLRTAKWPLLYRDGPKHSVSLARVGFYGLPYTGKSLTTILEAHFVP